MKPDRFQHFVAIDWSGAVGERHKGIAVALCSAGQVAPKLVRPGHRWSRQEVALWLRDDLPRECLVGIDLSMALPFADRDGYFPEWRQSSADARRLWALVDQICADDPHLSASSFVDHPEAAEHYRRHGGRAGRYFTTDGISGGRGRLRLTEQAQESMGCRPYSTFNLVGAAQVGKSSLTGMRLLHRLTPHLAIWPFDPLPDQGSVLVEIYTTLAAMAAGRSAGRSKIRSHAELDTALHQLGSEPGGGHGSIDDHASDAILTAAWLRRAAHQQDLWHPEGLNAVAQTEGWTFGAVWGNGRAYHVPA
ncbi:MAG: hypothetical protein RLZZ136_1260 [Pseudomonadota bacterium]